MPDDWPVDTIGAMARWLLERTDRLRQHPAALDAVNGITRAVGDAQRAVDRPADALYAGPCSVCGHPLYVNPRQESVTCERHDPAWTGDVAARRAWMLGEAEHILAHSAAAVHLLGLLGIQVTPVAVSRWVQAGRLSYRGQDVNGRKLLRLGDIVDLATRQSSKAAR